MLLSLLFACSGGSETPDYSNGDATAGEAVYSSTCIACHGEDAHGGSGPDLEEPFTNDADEDLAATILTGVGDMPAQDLDDTEVADVIAYVHSLF